MRELREPQDSREFKELKERERERADRREDTSRDRVHKEKVMTDSISLDIDFVGVQLLVLLF